MSSRLQHAIRCAARSDAKSLLIRVLLTLLIVSSVALGQTVSVDWPGNTASGSYVMPTHTFGTIQLGETPFEPIRLYFSAPTTIGSMTAYLEGEPQTAFAVTRQATANECVTGVPITNYCDVNVMFRSHYPGRRKGALEVRDMQGKLLTTVMLDGVAMAPMAAYNPQTVSVLAGGGTVSDPMYSGPATQAQLDRIIGLAVDGNQNIYIADWISRVVRKVSVDGTITTVAGNGAYSSDGYNNDGGAATSASLWSPVGVAIDGAGKLLIADRSQGVIRMVDRTGVIRTIAGNGQCANIGQCRGGDNGPALNAQLSSAYGLAIGPNGDIFVSQEYEHVVRKISLNGKITTVAGTGLAGYSGDGGWATQAQLNQPMGIAVDWQGNLYIADAQNNAVRKVSTDGTISTIAGTGVVGYSGDGGLATEAQLSMPVSIAVDNGGALMVADSLNQVIRRVYPDGFIITLPFGSVDARAITLDAHWGLYIAETDRVMKRDRSGTAPLDFGTVAVGSSARKSGIVVNIGNMPLDFSVSAYGGPFTALPNYSCQVSLEPGFDCGLPVEFRPLSQAPSSGTLEVRTNSLNHSNTVTAMPLTGNGGVAQTIAFPNPGAQTYGAGPISLGATASSGLPVSYTVVSGPATVSGSALTITGAGTVTVQATQAGNTGYTAATPVTQSFTVAPATLTITATNASIVAGQSLPTLGYTISGLVNGDQASVVTGTTTLTTTATSSSTAGTYPINFTIKALTAANYTFNYVDGTLTVTAASGTGSGSGFALSDFGSLASLTMHGSSIQAGNSIQLTQWGRQNSSGTLWYNQAVNVKNGFQTTFQFQNAGPSPAADGFAFVIQTAGPGATSGLHDGGSLGLPGIGEGLAVAFRTWEHNFAEIVGCGAGRPLVDPQANNTCNLADSSAQRFNISDGMTHTATISYVPGTMTVTLDGKQILSRSLTLANELNLPANGTAYVGFSGATGAGSETASLLNWSFTPAVVKVQPDIAWTPTPSQPKFGEQVTLTATVTWPAWNGPAATGTVKFMTGATLLGTSELTPVNSTSAQAILTLNTNQLTVGNNLIWVTYVGDTNYKLSGIDQGMWVLPATPTVTWSAPAAITYGTALTAAQLNASALYQGANVAGDYSYSPSAGTVLNVGSNQALSVSFTPTDATTYTSASAITSINVAPAPLSVVVKSVSKGEGQALPTLTGTVTGIVNGDDVAARVAVTYSTTATSTSPAGTYPITATVSGTAVGNYAVTLTAGTLTVTPSAPELAVSAISITGTPTAGGTISVSDTTVNSGGPAAAGTFTYLYLSTDGVSKSTNLGSRMLSAIAIGGSDTAVTTIGLPTNLVGSYYVIACADARGSIAESDETNNCKASARFSIAGPDLSVSAVTNSVTTIGAGATFTVTDTAANAAGGGQAAASFVYFYLSKDGVAKSTTIGSRAVPVLAAGASSSATTNVAAPQNVAGTYYVIACADARGEVKETDETNNCKATGTLTIVGADLTVPSVVVPGNVLPGATFSITETTANADGGASAASSYTYYYYSKDGITKNSNLGSRVVPALAVGANSVATVSLTMPNVAAGKYYVIACADVKGNVVESDENNNCKAAAVSVGPDTTAPVTTLSTARSQNASIAFTFTANETATFECSLDGGAYQTCASPANYSALSVGAHTFAVRATDTAGNKEAAGPTYSWTVDAPPTTTLVSASVSNLTNSNGATFTFSSNTANATFTCSIDSGAAVACASPFALSGLADGTHTIVIHAVDRWGTSDPVGASFTWQVDTRSPVVTSYTYSVTSASATMIWTTDEPATSKVNWGVGGDTSRVVAEDSNYVTSHSVRITGLSSQTWFSFIVSGHDAAGNAYVSTRKTIQTF